MTASRNIRSANQTSTITGASLRWTWTSRSHNVQNACDQAQSNRRYCKRTKVPSSTGMYYQTHYGIRPIEPVAAVASATVSGRPCRCLHHGHKKPANYYITSDIFARLTTRQRHPRTDESEAQLIFKNERQIAYGLTALTLTALTKNKIISN